MSLTASFIADFSSFMSATEQATNAMKGFKDTAGDLGPAADKSVQATAADYVELGAQIRQTAIGSAATWRGLTAPLRESGASPFGSVERRRCRFGVWLRLGLR